MLFLQLLQGLVFYLVFSLFGLIGYGWTRRIFGDGVYAYFTAKVFGWLGFAYVIWLAATLHVLDFQNSFVLVFLFLLLVAAGVWKLKIWEPGLNLKIKTFFRSGIFRLECLGAFLFAAYLLLRSYQPAIFGTERFMDMMLFTASAKTQYFPFSDGWLAGHTVNYYYYGAYLMSLVARLSFLPLALAYNFALGLVFSQTLLLSGLIAHFFTKRMRYALLASFMIVLAGSLFFAACQLKAWGTPTGSCSYASSTRLFDPSYIINEIPSYSFTVGDLHAHVLGLFLFLANTFLILFLQGKERWSRGVLLLLALGLASSLMTNAWDFVSLGLLFSLVWLVNAWRAFRQKASGWLKNILSQLVIGAVVGVLALLLASPFLYFYKSPVLGLGIAPVFVKLHQLTDVQYPTPLLGWLGIWGTMFFACLLGFWVLRKQVLSFPTTVLFLTSCLLLAGVEIFFIPDIYSVSNPPYFRANTVFKFGYHTWVFLCLAFVMYLAEVKNLQIKINKKQTTSIFTKKVFSLAVGLSVGAGLFYPFSAAEQFYLSENPAEKTLDGAAFMKTEGVGDYEAVHYINQNIKGRPVMVEAVGDSYTYFGRMAVFTGVQDPVNWLTHEWTWRLDAAAAKKLKPGEKGETGYGKLAGVSGDVRNIYESADMRLTEELLEKYKVEYVYVGLLERKTYPDMREGKFSLLGTEVYRNETAVLYKIEK